jgi:hypothetical protein
VREWNQQFCRNQRGRDRRVHIAIDEHPVGALSLENRLNPFHHARRLHSLRSGAHFQVDTGTGDFEVGEKGIRQRFVVVLSGMDNHLHQPRAPRRSVHRGELGEVRPSTDNVNEFHRITFWAKSWPVKALVITRSFVLTPFPPLRKRGEGGRH